MEIATRIKTVCSRQNDLGRGVMPPQVCPYCFGCAIATIVCGVIGNNNQNTAKTIPEKNVIEINQWLDKVEATLNS